MDKLKRVCKISNFDFVEFISSIFLKSLSEYLFNVLSHPFRDKPDPVTMRKAMHRQVINFINEFDLKKTMKFLFLKSTLVKITHKLAAKKRRVINLIESK